MGTRKMYLTYIETEIENDLQQFMKACSRKLRDTWKDV